MQGLTTTGQEIISSAMNGVTSTGGNLLNGAFGALNSIPGINAQPVNIQQDEELLDVFRELVDQINLDQLYLDQPNLTTESIQTSNSISQDEIPTDGEEVIPVYFVLL